MAKNDLVANLLLKTGNFDTNIRTAQREIKEFERKAKTAKDSVSAFGNGLGINVGALTKFGTAVGAAALAADTMKKSLQTNADFMDKFEETIQGGKAALDGFYTALGNGDLNGFFRNFKEITDAGEAYARAIDDANTAHNTMNSAMEKYKIMVDYCNIKMKDPSLSGKERKEWIDKQNEALQKQLQIQKLIAQAEINKRNKEFNRNFQVAGGNGRVLTEAQKQWYEKFDENGVTNWEKLVNYYESLQRTLDAGTTSHYNKDGFETYRTYTEEAEKAKAKLDAAKRNGSYYTVMAYKTMENEGQNVSTSFENEIEQLTIDVAEASAELLRHKVENKLNGNGKNGAAITIPMKAVLVDESVDDWLKSMLEKTKKEFEEKAKWYEKDSAEYKKLLQEKSDAETRYYAQARIRAGKASAGDFYTAQGQKDPWSVDLSNIKIEDKTSQIKAQTDAYNEQVKALNSLGQSFGTFGSAMQGAGDDAKSIANVFVAASKAAALAGIIEAAVRDWSNMTVIGKIAAAVGGVAAITGMFASIQQFETGGIVGGSSYTGDKMLIRANSGEMILTRQQQNNLFNMIGNGGNGTVKGGSVEFKIKGQELVGVLNNYSRKTGKVL